MGGWSSSGFPWVAPCSSNEGTMGIKLHSTRKKGKWMSGSVTSLPFGTLILDVTLTVG